MATAPINPTHSAASISTTSAAVLAANTSRRYALLVNDGVADVYLNLGGTAVVNTGIRLAGNGGSFEVGPAFGNLFRGAINGITVSGTSTVLVTEGV